jgi:hypothetical protein
MNKERFENESAILNAVFSGDMTSLKGIEGLKEIGITEREAKALVYEAARSGRDRRKVEKLKYEYYLTNRA